MPGTQGAVKVRSGSRQTSGRGPTWAYSPRPVCPNSGEFGYMLVSACLLEATVRDFDGAVARQQAGTHLERSLIMNRWFCAFLLVVSSAACVLAEEPLAEFWQRGRVREMLVRGMPDKDLAEWSRRGVNCVMGVRPDDAHKHGLKTRTWFTLNSMRPGRPFDLDAIKKMAAVNKDGSYRRPYDPLFPSVANNWSACVNNPLWCEHGRKVFEKMAEDGHDGCHIDYASHYEPCFCPHCEGKWSEYAAGHDLEGTDLRRIPSDMRYRMHLREFRIRTVMDFLALVRDAARAVKPGFCTDGTWHQDSGSTYQWAYGDHFDLMCIEGTTWGPFPPASQQILWLKLAHALTSGKVAMSVTYHLVTEDGKRHHGRMASDRAKLALCEIMSQGAVSWLGLGGPGTGNLLREHEAMVKDVYTLWARLSPMLATRRDLGEVAIVFSPRSFLTSGASRKQLYAVGQALMQSHVPFTIVSDVGLSAEELANVPVTVLLDASALSDEAATALEAYVKQGGKLMLIGAEPKYDSQWRELKHVPRLLAKPKGLTGVVAKPVDGRTVWYWTGDGMKSPTLGASQSVEVNQTEAAPLAIEGESKALNVTGVRGASYSLYVDLVLQDGSNVWGQVATFNTGTHDWEQSRFIIEPPKPVKSAGVHILFRRGHTGTAWFRKVAFGPWDANAKRITKDLLRPGNAWRPYGQGFEVEEIAGEGPTIKVATGADVVRVAEMHHPVPEATDAVMQHIAPLLPDRRLLTVDGPGAECVYVDASRTEGGLLLQFLNYNAELHPRLPELDQQEADKTIAAGPLHVRLTVPGAAFTKATLLVPGRPDRTLQLTADRLVVPKLSQYAAVVLKTPR